MNECLKYCPKGCINSDVQKIDDIIAVKHELNNYKSETK
jgi:hypothetical protein